MGSEIRIFAGEPTDTREEIIRATYNALATHGYANLSIQRIGDEFDKSTSLLYHHYDTKDELLGELLQFVLSRIEQQVPLEEHATAYDQLLFSIDYVTGDLFVNDQRMVIATLMELRSQALHNATYRERFTQYDQFLHDLFSDIIAAGVDDDTFHDIDPDDAAECLLTITEGTVLRHMTTESVDLDAIRQEAVRYVDTHLLAGSPD